MDSREVNIFLAQALASARPDSTFDKIKLINIKDMPEFFIETVDNQIDDILSQQYKSFVLGAQMQ